MKQNIIIDSAIPFIKGVFDKVADVTYLPSWQMDSNAVRNADALIVRTRTRCNANLLDNTAVRYIFTATIGIDHIDTDYCTSHGIKWKNAAGCNASSVAQYIGSVLSLWAKRGNMPLIGKTIGIIGHGHVGKEVEILARMAGMNIMLNDPPLCDAGYSGYFSFDDIAEKADVLTFHTPLTFTGKYATYHLLNKGNISKLKRRPLIINAARGGVLDEHALLSVIDSGIVDCCAIDCWENEPSINTALLSEAFVATPHIAGYSADGKYNATKLTIEAVAECLNLKPEPGDTLPPKTVVATDMEHLPQLLLESYPIEADSDILKRYPEKFETFRNGYPYRREIEIKLLGK